ncbi:MULTISPECIES: aconitate hydratase AcnA [unclassified Thiobacillus]|uniref:aconitate hydratase AcnA n=1 Tax=unclassified Thiobacillus TaxID=2646513 RepID=UPI000869CEDF|nr:MULTISPECIES: aconitate hydratase AcnA [unclassified Thiobacillus]MBN8780415.1 aconitate hydratase AcnA [Thiobacillus sp.]ODV02996.1 MAG: aconitate hydratase 1 [Thiobacillus sp. SCN 63-57]OJY55557.1 MAG: aconitate hydratase 1 [Thiobacillus sp. 0-1251]
MTDTFNSFDSFSTGSGSARFASLKKLETALGTSVARLPVSIRVVLESVLRNCDGVKVTPEHVRQLASWKPNAERTEEIPFTVARVILQDFTGVPLLADLAAMRSAAQKMGKDPKKIEPLVPVDMVVDHSIQVDASGTHDALDLNMKIEFERNRERYQFLKWGMQAFDTFKVVPPGVGIVHQVNMEYLARGVMEKDGMAYPDTLVGTDSHTTMINGLGIVAWGVGGIEAEAAMLGQPVYFLTPDVVGVNLKGHAKPGVTATDVVLTITEMLRKAKVVGKFVEFFGEGAAAMSVTDRATIANMAPEYGATMGFFPVDEATCQYFAATGRAPAQVDTIRAYYQAQGLFGIPKADEIDYSQVLELDLASVEPSVAGPKRPQDRIALANLKSAFTGLMDKPVAEGGYGKGAAALHTGHTPIKHGDIAIAAITSCTNTSNPGVMLAAGLLAKKAAALGLKPPAHVKTSLGPGSRAVTEYLNKAGLMDALEQVGFSVVGYGCTTCIGNSGPLKPEIEKAIADNDLVVASVLSGNRNFEARVHQAVKANFLMSPPLVVAFALAGRVDIDFDKEAIGTGKDGKPVFLKDLWPSNADIAAVMGTATDAAAYRKIYADVGADNPLWDAVSAPTGTVYEWDAKSTYIQQPPFFAGTQAASGGIQGARALAIFGDSVTTDHISPAGGIKPTSPAGLYLTEHGVQKADFNSYGARRGNHEVMMRGTFANVRIKNLMIPGSEGGITLKGGEQQPIYDAAMAYQHEGMPLMIFAGEEYGTGSSRDWAAKGTTLLGVKAVVARSFERIHRANLAGMGVLPCQFKDGVDAATLKLDGSETFDLEGTESGITPQQDVTLVIHRADGKVERVALKLRIDTPIEVEYYNKGGILPFVLEQLVG